jgi:polyhydroxybutyrate depolymerase
MRLILIAVAILALTAPAQAASEFEIDVDGQGRRYVVEMPRGPRPAPAIVVLHGGAGTPERMRRITSFSLHEAGWVEVYPEGLDRQWNDGRIALDGTQLHETNDLAFLRAMISRLADEGVIDPGKVFFAGASNGGAMTLRVVCQAPELAAGAAVVIMNMPVGLDCPDGPPVPMLFIQGTADQLVPFAGGPVTAKGFRDRGAVLSVGETLARFALRNRCGPWEEFAIPDLADDGTRVRLRTYRGCAAALRQFIVDGGGHTWAGNKNRRWVEKLLGRTSLDISATFEIEAFFTEILER